MRSIRRRARSFLDGPRGSRRTLAIVILLVALGFFPAVTTPMNSDVAWLLHVAGSWMDGAELYVDLLETNPPLVVWVYAPATWLARSLNLSTVVGFLVWSAVILGASLALAYLVTRHMAIGRREADRRWLLVLFVFGAFVLAGRSFGQKDHLMVALTLPYLLAVAARAEGGDLSGVLGSAAGAVAAVGVGMKPHFLLLPLLVESIRWSRVGGRGRWWRSETIALASGLAVYVLAVLAVTPEYLSLVERFGSLYTGHGQLGAAELATQPATLLVIIGWAAYALTTGPPERRSPASVVLAAGLAFLAAGALQRKGWSYHFLPALVTGTWALALVVTLEARSLRLTRVLRAVLAVVLLLLVASSGWSLAALARDRSYEELRLERTSTVLSDCGPNDVLAVLSPMIRSSFPLVNRSGMRWGLRHHSQWALTVSTALEGASDAAKAPAGARDARSEWARVRRETVADLTARPPAYLLVDDRAARLALGDRAPDLMTLYRQDAEFRQLMERYVPEGRLAGYRVWRHAFPEDADDPCNTEEAGA